MWLLPFFVTFADFSRGLAAFGVDVYGLQLHAQVSTASIIVIMALAAMSVRQIRIWHDSVTLFEYMIAKLGDDPYLAEARSDAPLVGALRREIQLYEAGQPFHDGP